MRLINAINNTIRNEAFKDARFKYIRGYKASLRGLYLYYKSGSDVNRNAFVNYFIKEELQK